MSETVELADGREVPSACTQALDNFDETIWPGATFPTARAAIAAAVIEAAEPYLRKKWAEEWGIGDETSRPLYDARLRIGELEGEVHYKDREIRRLDFELNIALGFLEGDGE